MDSLINVHCNITICLMYLLSHVRVSVLCFGWQISPQYNKAESSTWPQLRLFVMDQTTKTFHSHLSALHEVVIWQTNVWFRVEYHVKIRTLIRQHKRVLTPDSQRPHFLPCSNKRVQLLQCSVLLQVPSRHDKLSSHPADRHWPTYKN